MPIHFEALWEECEKFHRDAGVGATVQQIIEELTFKVNLYKAVDTRTEIPEEERKKVKSRTLGEILLTLTHLSLVDDVNTYEALNTALQYRGVEHYVQKQPKS